MAGGVREVRAVGAAGLAAWHRGVLGVRGPAVAVAAGASPGKQVPVGTGG